MSTSLKTKKNMRLEAQSLLAEVDQIKAKGEDITPDEAARCAANTAKARELLGQIKACTTEEAFRDAEEAANDLKTLYEPDRPHLGGDGSSNATRHNYGEAWGGASLGETFVKSLEYKSYNPGNKGEVGSVFIPNFLGFAGHVKTTFTTATSTLTQFDRPPGLIRVEQQRLTVADLLGQGQTNSNTIRYPQEDTFTNAATTVAEGGTKPEAAFDTSEVDAPVRKIAVTAKITEEFWADFPAMQSYIDDRLRFMVGTTEEAQLLNGDGNAPNLRGILQTSGIQTQAKGTDTNPDAVHKAITKIRTIGFYEPDAIILHPTDWQIIKLSKDANGQYLFGGPGYVPYAGGGQRYTNVGEMWGMRAVVTTAISAGTALVGAFQVGATIFRRAGVNMSMTNTDQDDFVKNRITLRCESRAALAVWRPKAFSTVTGLA